MASPPPESDGVASAISTDGLCVEVTTDRLDMVYELGKAIGKGKFSTVYRAVRKADGVVVALKKIAIFDIMDVHSRDKCLKEIKLVRSLSHDNIMCVDILMPCLWSTPAASDPHARLLQPFP